MSRTVHVVKFGSGILDDPVKRDIALAQLVQLTQANAQATDHVILVHGGGAQAGRVSARLGVPEVKHEGRRITDAATLDVVTMVYAGSINKRLVAELQARGVNALGLSGADMNILRARRRSQTPIDFGFVGDVESVNVAAFNSLFDLNLTPVICSLTHDGAGQLFNTNADTIAADIASALSQSDIQTCTLSYCFELPGVLRDIADHSSLVKELDAKTYAKLRDDGAIHRGMLPKLENAFRARRAGVKNVSICAFDALAEQWRAKNLGTTII